mmetsp:Transcript_11986/g.20237  ORF Transcript_11986/g.20237 Transcript_11986/m.20237 type:complete len:190 (+) Transcript_11986:918-1487(+)
MDPGSVDFFLQNLWKLTVRENYLELQGEKAPFSKTNVLVVLSQLLQMIKDGHLSLSSLRPILKNLLLVEVQESREEGAILDDRQDNEEVVVDSVIKFWQNAKSQWLPSSLMIEVDRLISDFLLQKCLLTSDSRMTDYCLTKLNAFLQDERNVRLVASWYTNFDLGVVIPDDIFGMTSDQGPSPLRTSSG